MIQTPAELYTKLISDFNLTEHILCDLHKPCNKSNGHRCKYVMAYPIIDFDEVKTEYQRGKSGNEDHRISFAFRCGGGCVVH